jgi:hypothetical protein
VLSSLASIVPLLLVGPLTALFGPRLVLAVLAAADILALLYARSTLPRARHGASGTTLPVSRPHTGW